MIDRRLKSAVTSAVHDLHQAICAVTHGSSYIEQAVAVVVRHRHVQRGEGLIDLNARLDLKRAVPVAR